MGTKLSRPRISSIEDCKNLKYFNIFNYLCKYYENPSKLSLSTSLPFFKEIAGEIEFIILTVKINKKYSTSLWICYPADKSFNIWEIRYHSSERDINNIANDFIKSIEMIYKNNFNN